MVGDFVQIDDNNISLLDQFLESAGKSLNTFRYFDKRPISVIKKHLYTVAYLIDHQPAGYGHLDPDGQIVWLGIAVVDSFVGRGIGKEIMKHLLQKGNELELSRIRLSVDKPNIAAITLYEKMGFQRLSENDTSFFYEIDPCK